MNRFSQAGMTGRFEMPCFPNLESPYGTLGFQGITLGTWGQVSILMAIADRHISICSRNARCGSSPFRSRVAASEADIENLFE